MRPSNFVVPAPLPGHAIALFEPLAHLDFATLATAWSGILAVIYFALSIMLTRLTKLPYGYSLMALLPLGFKIPMELGQLVPIAVVCLVAAAIAVCKRHDALAGVLTAIATIEPHIGLPACVALFLCRPGARLVLVVAALAISALSARTVGVAGLVEYVQRVLPVHIASEARYNDQYSLTYLLTWLHAAVHNAIAIGQAAYWIGASCGVAVAIRLSTASANPRFLIFVPMAFSVIGGPYVHQEHLLAAVPLGVLLVTTAPPGMRIPATIALALVAWPLKFILELFDTPGIVFRIATGFVSAPSGPLSSLADAAWAERIAPYTGSAALFAVKLPSWIGLLLMAGIALRLCVSMRATRSTRDMPASVALTSRAM